MTLLKWRVFSAALILTISVIAPGVAMAAWSARRRYACGSTPTNFAVSQSV